ncbi:hypothetical protein Slin15195_G045260 [Septoria linicola]|uniref:Uncharacterized protein n=1 Tax=Septoria linicola TaxID=215465 RepID=A0A9Q9ASI1_9PEZI|nr:hypothetical protein Slin14017_G048780 [Septoria linicola]USW51207.1 hypothetical protein Slin15195_G045260 [Septoria linicola]
MDQLPVELLAHIAEDCDHKSQKQLRSTTKALHDLATPLVFDQIYVATFKHSVVKLKKLASSHLAKYVHKLTFFSDTLPKYSKAQWQRSIDQRPGFRQWRQENEHQYPDEPENDDPPDFVNDVCLRATRAYGSLPRHHFTASELDLGWKAFQRYYKEQEAWADYREARSFREAFCKLGNVRKVVAAAAVRSNEDCNKWPFWSRLYREMLVGPNDWKHGYCMDEAMHDYEDQKLPFKLAERATLCLLEGLSLLNGKNLDSFSSVASMTLQHIMVSGTTLIENWHRGPVQPADLLRDAHLQEPRRLWLAQPFVHLTDLSMRFDCDDSLNGYFISEIIHQILVGARELRRLTLIVENTDDVFDIPDDANDDEDGTFTYSGHARLFQVDRPIWPHIQHLALSTFVSARNFVNFLKLHASTLRSLELRRTAVFDAPSLLEQIPKVIQLDHVYVKGLNHHGAPLPHDDDVSPSVYADPWLLSDGTDFDAPYEMSMKAYLLGKTSEMPDLSQDHLGSMGPDQRTDRIGTEPYYTVFGRRDGTFDSPLPGLEF